MPPYMHLCTHIPHTGVGSGAKCSKGDVAQVGVVGQAELVAVHAPLPLARGATAEADAARPKGGAVLDPEEEVAEEAALDAIVPVLRVGGESLAPHVARDADVLLMVEVEALEEVVRGRGGQVDAERLWAGRPVPLADAGERLRGEHGNEARLVLVVRVEHERLPQLFTKDWTEVPCDARVEQVRPALTRAVASHGADRPRSAHRWADEALFDRLVVLGAPVRGGDL